MDISGQVKRVKTNTLKHALFLEKQVKQIQDEAKSGLYILAHEIKGV
jgi:hypothetical protein